MSEWPFNMYESETLILRPSCPNSRSERMKEVGAYWVSGRTKGCCVSKRTRDNTYVTENRKQRPRMEDLLLGMATAAEESLTDSCDIPGRRPNIRNAKANKRTTGPEDERTMLQVTRQLPGRGDNTYSESKDSKPASRPVGVGVLERSS